MSPSHEQLQRYLLTMAKPSTKKLLKEIQSNDLEQVEISITNKAIEWATAGFVEEANQLLIQLWQFNIPHSKNLWLADEALQVMWQVSKKQPGHVPFPFKETLTIETENWSRNFQPKWHESYTSSFINKDIVDLNGQELFVKAITAVYEKAESMAHILAALKRYIEQDNPVGYNYFHATTCACLIAARQDDLELTEQFIQLWGKGYLNYWNNYNLTYLMRDRKCAEYLSKGALATVFGLTGKLIRNETKELIEALSNRMLSGQSLVYHNLTWKQLLSKIAKAAIRQKTVDFAAAILVKNSLSKAPATKEAIDAAESRLRITLPSDYKKFLLTSNGLECFSSTGVTLASIDQVGFFVDIDSELVDAWTNSMEEVDPTFSEKLRSSIIIGGHDEEQQLLLIPLQKGEWECWHFSSWTPGEVCYPSFRFYMESELQQLEESDYLD